MDLSYTQNMEDTHLWLAFGGRRNGTYVDIGAGHPIADNVSFFFYERGWQGVAVEPQQKLIELYARLRPRDAAVAALIGTQGGEADFHVFEAFHGLSTTNMKHAEAATALGAGYRTVKVPMITLAELCRKHGLREIDFLKVDVEGAEADVLKSGDWTVFRPKVVVVEAIAPGSNLPSWESWEPFLLARGYRFMLFDTLNRFYVAEEAKDVAARFPRERAPWDSVRHMYEIGRAPENASHPEHALANISTARCLPTFSNAAARRPTPRRSMPPCRRSIPRTFVPVSAALPAATTAGRSTRRMGDASGPPLSRG
jgi:FkbM family methyltransferase